MLSESLTRCLENGFVEVPICAAKSMFKRLRDVLSSIRGSELSIVCNDASDRMRLSVVVRSVCFNSAWRRVARPQVGLAVAATSVTLLTMKVFVDSSASVLKHGQCFSKSLRCPLQCDGVFLH